MVDNSGAPIKRIAPRRGGYRLNGGVGAVLCDVCRDIIDGHLSYEKYQQNYGHLKKIVCWRCKEKSNGISDT